MGVCVWLCDWSWGGWWILVRFWFGSGFLYGSLVVFSIWNFRDIFRDLLGAVTDVKMSGFSSKT